MSSKLDLTPRWQPVLSLPDELPDMTAKLNELNERVFAGIVRQTALPEDVLLGSAPLLHDSTPSAAEVFSQLSDVVNDIERARAVGQRRSLKEGDLVMVVDAQAERLHGPLEGREGLHAVVAWLEEQRAQGANMEGWHVLKWNSRDV